MNATHSLSKTLDKALGAKASKTAKSFAREFFSQITDEDFDLIAPAQIEKIVSSHLRLMDGRKKGQIQIAFSSNDGKAIDWESRRTFLDIVTDDAAFLIDSVAALLGERHCMIDMLLHPRMSVRYDEKGKVILDPDGQSRQSNMHIVIKGHLSAEQQKALKAEIGEVIGDVYYATRDWQAMRVRAIEGKRYLLSAPEKLHARDDISEYSEFLDYLYDNNFTFLGCREYKFVRKGNAVSSQIVKGSGLGLLSDDMRAAYISETKQPLPHHLQELRTKMPALHISKVNRVSTVHRRVPLDAVTIQHFDEKGNVTGETLFIGLFTSVTYSRSLRSIPLLKYKSDMVLKATGFEPASHDGRAIRHILEKYPRDELFQIDVEDLYRTCLSILRLQERQRIALYCRKDPFNRYVSCLVYVPRDRFETRLRLQFQHILEEELGGVCTNYYSSVDDSPLVRILFNIAISQLKPRSFSAGKVEEKLQQAGRAWSDMLGDAVHRVIENDNSADRLIARYAQAFSADYCERYGAEQAVLDIDKIEECLSTRGLQIDLQRMESGLSLKLYTLDQGLVLSDILPILENMGMRVLTEHPFEVTPDGESGSVIIQDFSMTAACSGNDQDFSGLKSRFEEAFVGIYNRVIENDSLNALVVCAGLSARDITVLRAYVRYIRQSELPYSLPYIEQAVTTYPDVARLLVALFHAQFKLKPEGEKSLDAAKQKVVAALEKVDSLDHDKILRGIYDVICNSLRTNFYQDDGKGNHKPYLSIKLDSRKIPFLPNPKPYREIFVYSTRMEGVHLRNGRIARGGIRWSDRNEDFRTEILGLMKAQTVKNSVIVPSGAKGGFIVKHPPVGGDRAAMQAEGIDCYRMLVRGLLDITDNYGKAGKVVKPRAVTCRDGDDPYLVVAADKGTATFSDYANALSEEYGFWMGDGFASGGSAGYDHKEMGITARGAWESVKRHFREMGVDTQSQEFDVIGVGDMGGDVFGNGMLLSPYIRLVGAFNHAHIFCDPDPDVAKSFSERKRLFKAVLGWDHYDAKLLSKGGRIFSRKDKVLDLTPEIQRRFDLPKAKVSPPELIQAMLKARCDLMYLGGIGTYVKASSETHADAGDRSNDVLRINAASLRARVVGEGANLGFTQRARIEYAQAGGRVNADFVDNSAGVDTSDHEVNIKIQTSALMAKNPPKLTRKSRDTLLEGMTRDVAALVLSDNYQQTQAISLIEMQAADKVSAHQAFIQELERDGALDRALEFLPDDETFDARRKAGRGLTRPEIGIIVSYAKMRTTDEILATKLPDQVDMNEWLLGYFPRAMQEKFKTDILNHPLRREIIATLVANALVNRMGPTFARDCMNAYHVDIGAVASAFVAAVDVLGLKERWAQIEAMDAKVPAEMQLKAFSELARLLSRLIGWMLANNRGQTQIDALVKSCRTQIDELISILTSDKGLKAVMLDDQIQSLGQRRQEWVDAGFSADLSRVLAARSKIGLAPYVLQLSQELKKPVSAVAEVYYPLGMQFGFSWLRTQVDKVPKLDRWGIEAAQSLDDQIDRCQVGITRSILKGSGKGATFDSWMRASGAAVQDVVAMISDMKRTGISDLTVLMVLLQRMERLV